MGSEIAQCQIQWGLTYRLVDTTSVEGLHRSFGCTWVVVFDEAVVETLALELFRGGC